MNKETLIEAWQKLGYNFSQNSIFIRVYKSVFYLEEEEKISHTIYKNYVTSSKFQCDMHWTVSINEKELELITKTMEFLKGSGE